MPIIYDSDMTFEQALKGSIAPQEIIEQLVLLDVIYYSFDDKLHQGQIMVNKDVSEKVEKIFRKIFELKFPIGKCVPMSFYGWDDEKSMVDNNSSGFCYRSIARTNRLSLHSYGDAIDINPVQNPLVRKDGSSEPLNSLYDVSVYGTLVEGSELVKYITKDLECRWGRYFTNYDDNHHFDIR